MAAPKKARSNKPRNDLSAEFVRSLFEYNPRTGILRWKHRSDVGKWWNTRYAGKELCTIDKDGYLIALIGRKRYPAHRLAWIIVTGEWPKNDIDHRRKPRTNNKFKNLREATRAQNIYNSDRRSDNTSGHRGVYWNKAAQKWQAFIKADSIYRYLGIYKDKTNAIAARQEAAKNLHGPFARKA